MHIAFFLTLISSTGGWEWTDWIAGGGGGSTGRGKTSATHSDPWEEWSSAATLSLERVSELRVRDIKRRLARTHGYSADELAKMILKKELIEALAFEEEKVRLKIQDDLQRWVLQRGIIVAILAIVVVYCWPLIQQGYEVAMVNFVVYTDRKKLEALRCWELKTKWGMVGVALMLIIDLLQAWLTISILLSWVMRSKYFFPTPNIPIRPAQFLGGPAEKAFGGYGINIGSMLVTWGLRFVHTQIEYYTGRALLAAQRKQRKNKANRSGTTHDEGDEVQSRAARQSRREERRKARQAAAAALVTPPPSNLPSQWKEDNNKYNMEQEKEMMHQHQQHVPTSREHEVFMQQIFETPESTGSDELD